ncbi:DUF305 domain-containing protein [Enterobacteriaceae bacterium ESL0689]|nr:DUF305 domain-containing protein [Enterobacteriaceae bacterium ESL0689]
MKIKTSLLVLLMSAMPVIAAEHAKMHTPEMASSPVTQEYMDGMKDMHEKMMAGIADPDPDKAFAKGMTAHHEGAISMAETELKYGKDPEMKKLAQEIINAQKKEINQMNDWLSNQK